MDDNHKHECDTHFNLVADNFIYSLFIIFKTVSKPHKCDHKTIAK